MRGIIAICGLLTAFSTAVAGQGSPTKYPPIKGVTVEVEGGQARKVLPSALAKLRRIEVKAKDHDGVEGTYSGFELRDLIVPAGALGKDLRGPAIAQYLVVEGSDGYHAVYSITELDPDFTDKIVILADKRDGKPLAEKDGPWQVIATNEKKHARWVRQVVALKVRTAR